MGRTSFASLTKTTRFALGRRLLCNLRREQKSWRGFVDRVGGTIRSNERSDVAAKPSCPSAKRVVLGRKATVVLASEASGVL